VNSVRERFRSRLLVEPGALDVEKFEAGHASRGLPEFTLDGGPYASATLKGGYGDIVRQIAPTFERLRREHAADAGRRSIEFYKRHTEVILYLPIEKEAATEWRGGGEGGCNEAERVEEEGYHYEPERMVKRWEYQKIAFSEVSRRRDEIDLLCDAGEEGWELVTILPNSVAYLKREVVGLGTDVADHRNEKPVEAEPAEVEATASNGAATPVKAKYRDAATGDTWSGRGRMATWLKRKQDAGEDIDRYLV
jgi:DNA-binding protein H-NS